MRSLCTLLLLAALILGTADASAGTAMPAVDDPAAASAPVADGGDGVLPLLLRRIRVEGGFAVGRLLAVAGCVIYLPDVASYALEPLVESGAGLGLVLALALGLAADRLIRRVSRQAGRGGAAAGPLALVQIGLREVGALVVFALVAGTAPLLDIVAPGERGTMLIAAVILGVVVGRVGAIAGRLALMPGRQALRLLPLSDRAAVLGWRWVLGLAALVGAGTTVIALLGALDLHGDIVLLVTTLVGLSIALLLGAMAWHARRALDGWHRSAIAYVLLVWALWTVNLVAECDTKVGAIAASGAILAGCIALDRMVRRRIAEPARAMRRAARVLVAVGSAAAFALAWGFDPRWLAGGSGWGATVGAVVTIAATLLVAWLAWSLLTASIDRHLTPVATPGEDMMIAGRGQTLLPLVRNVILAVIVVIAGLVVLAALGVNIGPLLAGAGIVGLAVGFGAQTLVRDIVAGVFFLIDDAFRIGEYVEAGDRRGTVEGMSVRSLRLRHHRGAIHTIPFGELRALTNHSRDWVIFKFELRLPFDTDVVRVRKLIKRIGEAMLADDELGPQFLQPLKSQGVTRIDDSALVMAVKFMCRPNEQWQIRREAYNRIQAAFADNGIQFATRHVTVLAAPGAGEPAGGAARVALVS